MEPTSPRPLNDQLHSDRQRLPDLSSPFAGLIFLTGSFFGMGMMLFVLQLWRPSDEPDIEHYRSVRNLVLESYVGETSEQELLESALRGMLGELDDYSRYYVEKEVETVNRDTSGQTIGIGVIMRYGEAPTIVFPVANSPAAAAGLRVGDVILSLDGQSVDGLDQDEVSDRIRGKRGTTLHLSVRGRDGDVRDHEVERSQLLVPSVRRVRMADKDRHIGYLALVSFSNETLGEFDAAVASLLEQGMTGLIVDMRGNPGGVLAAAVHLAQRFVPNGLITSTEGRGVPHTESGDPEEARYQGLPLVLLVDGGSASASEVLAGALQDHRVAAIVGTPTFGKGVVQTISRFTSRRAIAKLTTSYYYTPAHRNVQRSSDDSHAFGLWPDVEIDVARAETSEVLEYLHSFEPPAEAIEDLRNWSREASIEFSIDPPTDAQLSAALALMAGRIPTRKAQN